MKKKTIFLLISLIVYCCLFYQQSIGVNVLIFNGVVIICLGMLDTSLLKQKNWCLVAASALMTAIGAFLYGSVLACVGNVIALLLLANLSREKEASLFYALIQTGFSYIVSPLILLVKGVDKLTDVSDKESRVFNMTVGTVLKFLIPTVILLFFFFVYKASNPVFSNFINQFEINISGDFIRFLLVGGFLLYFFFNQYSHAPLVNKDRMDLNFLERINEKEISLFRSIDTEYSSGVLMFILLNGLLLLVNGLDLQYILFAEKDIHLYSDYIHQGINSSIFSVIVAILVTLYFFRGNLNFYSKNKTLKRWALIWIGQNILLLFTCIHKNYSYIDAFGLTQKRIGVYFYLLITLIGLTLTWIKITRMKSNTYLLRTNIWSVFSVLVVSSLFNWNRIILHHNTTYQSSIERDYYLENLPQTSLPFLLNNWERLPTDRYGWADWSFKEELIKKKKHFLKKYHQKKWQSWNLEDDRIYREIKETEIK